MNERDKELYNDVMIVAEFSTCLSRKIGALILCDDHIIATGFNGPPPMVTRCGHNRILRDDSLYSIDVHKRNLCPRKAMGFRSGGGLEYCTAIHAEVKAILYALRAGVSTMESSLYVTCGIPCKDCLKIIIACGIREIVCTNVDDWYDELSKYLVRESGIKIRNYEGEEVN